MSPRAAMQQRVRETMLAAGGYWRPLAAVARLLEELGELAELPGPEADELADLWIITAALGDQFLAELPEPGTVGGATEPTFAALVATAGPIARVVNYYDGPKKPRAGTRLPSLADAVVAFHTALAAYAHAHGVALDAAVGSKLDVVLASPDMRRFELDRSDPSTAPALGALAGELAARGLEQAWPERLWGAPSDGEGSTRELAEAIAASLTCFARAARHEHLEGYVVRGPRLTRAQELDWLRALLAALGPSTERAVTVAGLSLTAAALDRPATDGPERQRETYVLLAPAR